MRWENVASLMVLLGLGAQGAGLYQLGGWGWASLVLGCEVGMIGFMGVLRRVG